MRSSCTQGSALLIVLVSLSSVLIVGASLWRSTAYLVEITHAKATSQRQDLLVHAGLVWLKAFLPAYHHQVATYLARHEVLSLSCAHWPTGAVTDVYSLELSIKRGQALHSLSAQVILKDNYAYAVAQGHGLYRLTSSGQYAMSIVRQGGL